MTDSPETGPESLGEGRLSAIEKYLSAARGETDIHRWGSFAQVGEGPLGTTRIWFEIVTPAGKAVPEDGLTAAREAVASLQSDNPAFLLELQYLGRLSPAEAGHEAFLLTAPLTQPKN